MESITLVCGCGCHGCEVEMDVEKFYNNVMLTINDKEGNATASIHLSPGAVKKLRGFLDAYLKKECPEI